MYQEAKNMWSKGKELVRRFHEDEEGVAMTEYIIVFSLITIGSTIALIGTGYYIKGYRDFMVFWMSSPAV